MCVKRGVLRNQAFKLPTTFGFSANLAQEPMQREHLRIPTVHPVYWIFSFRWWLKCQGLNTWWIEVKLARALEVCAIGILQAPLQSTSFSEIIKLSSCPSKTQQQPKDTLALSQARYTLSYSIIEHHRTGTCLSRNNVSLESIVSCHCSASVCVWGRLDHWKVRTILETGTSAKYTSGAKLRNWRRMACILASNSLSCSASTRRQLCDCGVKSTQQEAQGATLHDGLESNKSLAAKW